MRARIAEVFKSVQGEGVYRGASQVFVRFFGCNLNCAFCDTKLNFYQNLTLDEVLEKIFSYKDYHSVSLTGGEPLLQIDFLKNLAKYLKEEGKTIYLETNGTLYNNLSEIIEYVDIIAMDFKSPSSTSQGDFWGEHKEFLKVALRKKVFVKAVICRSTTFSDLKKAVELLNSFKEQVSFIIQPNSFEIDEELNDKIEYFFSFSGKYLSDVKIAGQLHKAMSWR